MEAKKKPTPTAKKTPTLTTNLPEPSMMVQHLEARIEQLRVARGISFRALTPNLVKSAEFDHATDQMILMLTKRLLAGDVVEETKKETEEFKYPANWWQHLKFQVFHSKRVSEELRAWLVKRWPVKLQSVTFTSRTVNQVTRMCPHVEIPDDTGTHLRWLVPVKSSLKYSDNGY